MRGAPIDDLGLLDAYWTVYAYFTDGLDDAQKSRVHAIIDERRRVLEETTEADGVSAADKAYLAQLGLTPERIRASATRGGSTE